MKEEKERKGIKYTKAQLKAEQERIEKEKQCFKMIFNFIDINKKGHINLNDIGYSLVKLKIVEQTKFLLVYLKKKWLKNDNDTLTIEQFTDMIKQTSMLYQKHPDSETIRYIACLTLFITSNSSRNDVEDHQLTEYFSNLFDYPNVLGSMFTEPKVEEPFEYDKENPPKYIFPVGPELHRPAHLIPHTPQYIPTPPSEQSFNNSQISPRKRNAKISPRHLQPINSKYPQKKNKINPKYVESCVY